jgi:Uma2 family endonuclease
MSTAAQLMTFAEFEQLPYMPGKQELINGKLITMPPPEDAHSVISIRILQMLLMSGLPSGRVRADHTGYRMGGGWVEPDVSVTWPDQPHDGRYLSRAPMIAVEVLSPGENLEEKLSVYFDEGALEIWILSIREKSMTVCRRGNEGVIRMSVQGQYKCEAIGVTVSLPELFEE